MIAREAGVTTSEKLADLVRAGLSASATVAVKLNVPVTVGVPEITPEVPARVSPEGRAPDVTDQAYGATPPLACRTVEYEEPIVPEDTVVVVIAIERGATTSEKVADFVCAGLAESVTVAVKLKVPLTAGVPEMVPLVARLTPAGRLPEVNAQLYGAVPPLACSEFEYAEPVVADGRDDELIVKGVGVADAATTGRDTVVVAD